MRTHAVCVATTCSRLVASHRFAAATFAWHLLTVSFSLFCCAAMMARLSLLACACAAVFVALVTVPASATVLTNPVLGGVADPDVLRVDDPVTGKPTYFLTHTIGNDAFPLYTSNDLVTWTRQKNLFGIEPSGTPGTIFMNGYWYCNNWAPEIRPSPAGGYILSFTSCRYTSEIASCPGYDEGGGTFVAWSKTPYGPFYDPSDASFPRPLGASLDPKVCPTATWDLIPHSNIVDQHSCMGALPACNSTARLDCDLFTDPLTNTSWFSYAWFTNPMPIDAWEMSNAGEHIHVVKLDHSDPRYVTCDEAQATKVWMQSPHDEITTQKLQAYCERCGEQLSFSKGRMNETMQRGGAVWGVVEGTMLHTFSLARSIARSFMRIVPPDGRARSLTQSHFFLFFFFPVCLSAVLSFPQAPCFFAKVVWCTL